jgi:hypothetical protein
LHMVFTSLDFSAVIFLQNRIIRLVSKPDPGGPGLCIMSPVIGWPSYTTRHWVPFSSPSTTLQGYGGGILTYLQMGFY